MSGTFGPSAVVAVSGPVTAAVPTNGVTTGSITTNTGQVALAVGTAGKLAVGAVLTGVTAATLNFEASLDSTTGTDGTWFPVSALRTTGVVESAATSLSATPAYAWEVAVSGFAWFRVRASAGTFGTAALTILAASRPTEPLVAVYGGAVRSTTIPNALLTVGGAARATNTTAGQDNRITELRCDLAGNLIVKPFSPRELDWTYANAADATPYTGTGLLTLSAAVATYRQYLTGLSISNTAATASEIVIQDSTATPVILWRGFIGASASRDITFPTPPRSGSGTASAVNLRAVTTGTSLFVAAQGYVAL